MASCETTDAIFSRGEDLTTSFFFLVDVAAIDFDFFKLDKHLAFEVPRALEASIAVFTIGWISKDERNLYY